MPGFLRRHESEDPNNEAQYQGRMQAYQWAASLSPKEREQALEDRKDATAIREGGVEAFSSRHSGESPAELAARAHEIFQKVKNGKI